MFEKNDPKVSFPEIDHKVIEFWKDKKIFEKTTEGRKDRPIFNFYDGPPFATGLPHYGHILAGTIKDAIPRYKTMKGYFVPRPNGWDCHGLPVEYEIEKELNISGKPEIEVMGVDKFNDACKGIVFRYTSEWEKTINRMGRWVDFEHSYATMDRTYMESIWWVFKQIWDKDLIYQDYRSTWYCPRCGTPLSNFEVNQGYKDNVVDPSVFVKFQLEDEANTFLLVWTTTPWTLPGNAAVAIHPNIEYVKIKLTSGQTVDGHELTHAETSSVGQCFILAKERLSIIGQPYEIVKTYKAKDLKGKKYRPLYSFITSEKKGYYIALADFVTVDDGTGIVHIAPAFGEDDFNLGKELDLPVLRTVDEEGRIAKEVTLWAGTFVKQADDLIKDELAKRELLYQSGTIRHTYPFCWRCDSPLISYSLKTWFVRVSEIRDRLVANNKKINWVPAHIQDGRFGKWLEQARDWNIGRNRYWGTPLPIWECSCGHHECVGSIEELKQKAASAFKDRIDTVDLHRPWIDEVELTCLKCSKNMKRIEEVLDCWFESGSMPYAQAHYPFENKEQFEKSYPADFIAEGMDQTRGWFYTLHVIATILFDQPAFKNCIVNGIGQDEKGVKLSKRLRNYTEPEKLMDDTGTDAMRYFFFASTPMGEDWKFSDELVREKMRKVMMILWNSYVFFTTYASIDNWSPESEVRRFLERASPEAGGTKSEVGNAKSTHSLDRWILSRLQSLTEEMTAGFESYDLTRAARPIEGFVNQLSTWYIRRSRRRFWKSESDTDKENAYQTLYTVLVTLIKLIAPIMPFVSEEMYQNLVLTVDPKAPESIHLSDYPVSDPSLRSVELEDQMALVQDMVEGVRALRSVTKIKVRQPLPLVAIKTEKAYLTDLPQDLIALIQDELNVKEFKVVETLPTEGGVTADLAQASIFLSTTITPELKREGMVRDLVREIQSARKTAGLEIEDRIAVTLEFADEDLKAAIAEWDTYMKKETLSDSITLGAAGEGGYTAEIAVQGVGVKMGVRKH